MTREDSKSADEAAVRAVIESITKAVRAKDVEAMLAQCSPQIVTLDMVPPPRHQGRQAEPGLWARTPCPFDPRRDYEVHELDISVDGDVAFARCLNRFGGTKGGGRRIVN